MCKGILPKLKLPYRCTGDSAEGILGFTHHLLIDMEVYSAAQGALGLRWSSGSAGTFLKRHQSNRLKLRFKGEDKNPIGTLSWMDSCVRQLPRIVASILENNQNYDEFLMPKSASFDTWVLIRNLMAELIKILRQKACGLFSMPFYIHFFKSCSTFSASAAWNPMWGLRSEWSEHSKLR